MLDDQEAVANPAKASSSHCCLTAHPRSTITICRSLRCHKTSPVTVPSSSEDRIVAFSIGSSDAPKNSSSNNTGHDLGHDLRHNNNRHTSLLEGVLSVQVDRHHSVGAPLAVDRRRRHTLCQCTSYVKVVYVSTPVRKAR